jgi:hypothetical protein
MKMEVISSSETSIHIISTRRHILEDGILQLYVLLLFIKQEECDVLKAVISILTAMNTSNLQLRKCLNFVYVLNMPHDSAKQCMLHKHTQRGSRGRTHLHRTIN